jgi:hypothetical protein
MKYMLLMNEKGTQADWDEFMAMPTEDIERHMAFMHSFNEELTASGELVGAEGLSSPDQAKIVRAREDGSPAVTDGPFPEAKEWLAGYWIVDCESLERAIELAAKASTAPGRGGAPMNIPIEVRQVMSGPGEEM